MFNTNKYDNFDAERVCAICDIISFAQSIERKYLSEDDFWDKYIDFYIELRRRIDEDKDICENKEKFIVELKSFEESYKN